MALILGFQRQAANVSDSELTRFHSWTKVTDMPYPMSPQSAVLCIQPTASQLRARSSPIRVDAGPHQDYYVDVWVNDKGLKAMTDLGVFPAGSVIVKEKLRGKGSREAELSTVMIKREKGFNPACGDWEFATLDGTGKKVTSRGKLSTCMGCHQRQAIRDYVFRPYISGTSK